MKVFVTGATGVLGHRLVERLADRRHEVYGLVRDEAGADLVTGLGGVPRRGDVLDAESLERTMPDVDAVVHAATSIPTTTRPSEDDWQRNDRVRRDGIRNLVAVAGDRVERFLFPSVVWVARQPDGSSFDETAERHPDRTTKSVVTVEDYLEAASANHGFDVAVLRCGYFYAPDAAHTRQFGRSTLVRELPVVGQGLLGRRDARLSFLHADDAARAFADAIDAEATGCYHVVDERPVTFADFLTTLADKLDAPSPRRVPAWLARLLVGTETANLFAKPMPTTNERFHDAVGWEPKYPSFEEGLTQVVNTWVNDGTLRETATGCEWNGE